MVKVTLDYEQYEELLVLARAKAMQAKRENDPDETELWESIVQKFDAAN
jgi:hypothetical protein